MRRKPKGMKYRNLHARGSAIVYERILHGRRIKRSLGVDDWNEAAAIRDALEARLGAGGLPQIESPTFEEAAASYLAEGLSHLAPCTREDHEAMLADGGSLLRTFGAMRLDAIRRVHLLDWWGEFIERGGRTQKTGRNYLDPLAGLFGWAQERELIEESPVDVFRDVLRRRNRTKRGRKESQAGAKVNPIEKPQDVCALVWQAEKRGGKPYLLTLLMLDAGLRLGEATALDWRDVDWNRSALHVRASLSRGKHLGPTKSGRERRVDTSLRLLSSLREGWMRQGRPESGFVARVDHANFRNRTFRSLCRGASIGDGITPKSLRDTYASQLLTAGVQLGYISAQLGHADVSVTAKHYARWCGDTYRPPLTLGTGQVPADLLAFESHQSPTIAADA